MVAPLFILWPMGTDQCRHWSTDYEKVACDQVMLCDDPDFFGQIVFEECPAPLLCLLVPSVPMSHLYWYINSLHWLLITPTMLLVQLITLTRLTSAINISHLAEVTFASAIFDVFNDVTFSHETSVATGPSYIDFIHVKSGKINCEIISRDRHFKDQRTSNKII